jgi:hypothetical protein
MQLGLGKRERLLREIVGQFGHSAGGLDKVPAMREQIHDAPLKPLGAGSNTDRRCLRALQNPGAGGGPQRCGGLTEGPAWIGTEAVSPALGHRALMEQRRQNEVHPDQVIDDVSYVPLATRRRSRPLIGWYPIDQVTDYCGCTRETVEDPRVRHSVRLRHGRADATLVFGR